ncbi:MAG: energy transducer TonB, partial [Prevotella sp.]|nr:energy transducer TonB [Candidatus Prevotella equi]
IEVGMPIAIVEGQSQYVHSANTSINWHIIIAYIYLVGVIVTALVKLYQLAMLYFTIRRGVLWKDEKDGVSIYCHANNIVPFSWFSTIVISEQDYRLNAKEIIGHEMGHIRHHHSWDICLVNIVEVIQWMNPLAWILASSLRNVHEYEADDAVLRSGVNARQYQTLLIRKAVGASSYTFANSFNHSQLKKRFTMMFRKDSNPWMRTKALYIIPVTVIALSAFATPELNNRIDAITQDAPSVIADKGTKKSVIKKENILENADNIANADTVHSLIVHALCADGDNPEGVNAIMEVADDKSLFIVDGKKMTRKEFQAIDRAKIESAEVVMDKKKIKDYTKNPNVSAVVIIKMLSSRERYAGGNLSWTVDGKTVSLDIGVDNVFDVVEHMPEYQGGMEELMKYLSTNIRYPKIAFENGVSARVLVQFIVEKDGYLSSVKTINFHKLEEKKPASEGNSSEEWVQAAKTDSDEAKLAEEITSALTNEAQRVVASMPKWTPGTQNGKPARVKYVIPVTFRLQ